MNDNDKKLAHRLKIKFGTAPAEPTESQLDAIKRDLKTLLDRGHTPTERDWRDVISKHCPSAGRYGYAGADNSDLTTLLKMATNKSGE
ncbi:hypothetical protein D3C86_1735060 [compost metagenome]